MQKTVNPNACESAKELLNYLSEMAGKAIITGQHTQTIPMEEIDYTVDCMKEIIKKLRSMSPQFKEYAKRMQL